MTGNTASLHHLRRVEQEDRPSPRLGSDEPANRQQDAVRRINVMTRMHDTITMSSLATGGFICVAGALMASEALPGFVTSFHVGCEEVLGARLLAHGLSPLVRNFFGIPKTK